jgi:hypothetical protein
VAVLEAYSLAPKGSTSVRRTGLPAVRRIAGHSLPGRQVRAWVLDPIQTASRDRPTPGRAAPRPGTPRANARRPARRPG